MNSVQVRQTIIGEGIPKICVPIVGVTKNEIISEALALDGIPVDVVEWRVDWFEDCMDFEQVEAVLEELRVILKELPLLMTFRTKKEGGEKEIDVEHYMELNIKACQSGFIDLVDVELFSGDELVNAIIEEAHKHNVKVVVSNHDFDKTPEKKELLARLFKMQELGADLPKIAVMPQSKKDVLTLLSATEEMSSTYADRPIITMSMAGDGCISRLCGEVFGSALTFGAAQKASAPGQLKVDDLQTVLNILHNSINYK